ncbi:MAG TPA: RsmE family RNA methyltransferase [Flavitalea sp.]|nr:RsmE family RNA methyltransferase [Flavitalea sp.]
MSLSYFYTGDLRENKPELMLDEDTSRHIIQVLRMDEGENLKLTDGKGNAAEAFIITPHKKHTTVQITSFTHDDLRIPKLTIAVSLVKNASRFEWLLEKATELGVAEIIPLVCERTERQKFRHDRMFGICKSAMLQSMQTWLPQLHEPVPFNEVALTAKHGQKMIAHCAMDVKVDFSSLYTPSFESHVILIGPEGDFTDEEIALARGCDFVPVSLGPTRLRTETAGIFAAAWAHGAIEDKFK